MRMVIALGRGGLMEYQTTWTKVPCPLAAPTLLAADGAALTAVDNAAHALWTQGRVMTVDRGIEALHVCGGHAWLLSGETDCLTLLDLKTRQRVLTAPCGVYPKHLCRAGDCLAVCGGADGTVRVMRMRDLVTQKTLRLPGITERVAYSGGWLHVLCAVGDAAICCHYARVHPSGQAQPVTTLPGLPGALCPDGGGGVWAASSEAVCHYGRGALAPDRVITGSGLITRMACAEGLLLASDSVRGRFCAINAQGNTVLEWQGDVGEFVVWPT